MEHCKAELVRLAEELARCWDYHSCVVLRVHCEHREEDDAIRKFLSAIWMISRRVIRPALTTATLSPIPEVIELTPSRPEKRPLRITAVVTRGRTEFNGQHWESENQRWESESGSVESNGDLSSDLS